MTVVVAARSKTGIVVAADSQITAGWEKRQGAESKLWTAKPYAIGAAGCLRTAQVVHHWTTWPKYRPDEDTDCEAFLVKQVVPAIRAGAEDAGVIAKVNEQTRLDIELVIAWGDNLAQIAGNGAVVVPRHGRCAVGSGAAEALGYLGESGPWTVAQVIEAARRATITDLGCAGPIDYVTTSTLEIVRGAQ